MQKVRMEQVTGSAETRRSVVESMKSGAIFIYPTDTVYGIGCNATDSAAVEKIRAMKRATHPFSVIAPSKGWIKKNLAVKDAGCLKKLPGPYTFIFAKKKAGFLSAVSKGDSLGVRMPDHPFCSLVALAQVPFVTTSANISGQPTIASPEAMPEALKSVDFFLDAGEITGKPSTVIDMTGEKPKTIRE